MVKHASAPKTQRTPAVDVVAAQGGSAGPVLIVATVLEPGPVDEHELARAMHGAAVEGLKRAGLSRKAVRLTVHTEVVG